MTYSPDVGAVDNTDDLFDLGLVVLDGALLLVAETSPEESSAIASSPLPNLQMDIISHIKHGDSTQIKF
jgi:hypothetical protein